LPFPQLAEARRKLGRAAEAEADARRALAERDRQLRSAHAELALLRSHGSRQAAATSDARPKQPANLKPELNQMHSGISSSGSGSSADAVLVVSADGGPPSPVPRQEHRSTKRRRGRRNRRSNLSRGGSRSASPGSPFPANQAA
jgi:hypothetical protein